MNKTLDDSAARHVRGYQRLIIRRINLYFQMLSTHTKINPRPQRRLVEFSYVFLVHSLSDYYEAQETSCGKTINLYEGLIKCRFVGNAVCEVVQNEQAE